MLKYYSEDGFGDDIFNGFFTRLGGVSSPPYAGLNCGIGSDDNAYSVQGNRELVATNIGTNSVSLLSLYQVHGAKVIKVNERWEERPKADGFVTDRAGIALGILTADCAPVLFYGRKNDNTPVIGAAHAGWGGAFKGVLENTIAAMGELGAVKEQIRACVGPCISKSSYEVDTNFMDKFTEHDKESERFFHAAVRKNHVMFDLSGYCAWRLSKAGLNNITIKDIDTYKNETEFFSYRRATHRGEKDYGRQISVICIKP